MLKTRWWLNCTILETLVKIAKQLNNIFRMIWICGKYWIIKMFENCCPSAKWQINYQSFEHIEQILKHDQVLEKNLVQVQFPFFDRNSYWAQNSLCLLKTLNFNLWISVIIFFSFDDVIGDKFNLLRLNNLKNWE